MFGLRTPASGEEQKSNDLDRLPGCARVLDCSQSVAERRNLRLPLTIEDALERMENSSTVEKYLGKTFITGYVAVKRAEHENFKRVISSWEREYLLFAV